MVTFQASLGLCVIWHGEKPLLLGHDVLACDSTYEFENLMFNVKKIPSNGFFGRKICVENGLEFTISCYYNAI